MLLPAQLEIASTACGSCRRAKQVNQPLCHACYYTLPRDNRRFLYSKSAAELANAYAAAKDWLAKHRNWKGKGGKVLNTRY